MQQPEKMPRPPRKTPRADPKEDKTQKQRKAEMAEVLGRHGNVGQKDHKGAR